MGCAATTAEDFPQANVKLKKTQDNNESFDDDADGGASTVDFSCQYRGDEFAADFLELSGYEKNAQLPLKQLRPLLMKQFTFLIQEDIDRTYLYIYSNRLENVAPPRNLDEEKLNCLQFIKLGYVFYRFYAVLEDPRMALFYFLDEQFNARVNFKQIRQLIRIHFGIDAKYTQLIFGKVHSKEGLINLTAYKKLLQRMAEQRVFDELGGYFKQEREEKYMPENLDKNVDMRADEVFSDISMGKQDYEQARRQNLAEKKKREKESKTQMAIDGIE